VAEVDTQVIIAEKLGYINESNTLLTRVLSIKQMLLVLIKHLKNENVRGEK